MCLLTKAVCFLFIVCVTVSIILAVNIDDDGSSINIANNDRVIDFARGIETNLVQSSILFGVLSELEGNTKSDSNICQRDVVAILNGIYDRDLWAIKLLDTSYDVAASFVFGNNFWFTSKQSCYNLNEPIKLSLSDSIPKDMAKDLLNSTSPVPLTYWIVYANFTSPNQIDLKLHYKKVIHIGLCVPASCTGAIIENSTQKYFNKHVNQQQNLLNFTLKIIGSKEPTIFDLNLFTFPSVYWLTASILFLIFITITAQFNHKSTKQKSSVLVQSTIHLNESTLSTKQKILNCFYFNENFSAVFENKTSTNFFGVIAGMRTITCIWIIFFHLFYHTRFAMDNVPELNIKMEWFIYQPVFQAYLYVDVFFVLSAILLVYNFLKNKETIQTIRNNDVWSNGTYFGKYVLHRYIRLTPVVTCTVILSQVFVSYFEKCSIFWIDESNDLYCRNFWWQDLLYIQNFVPVDQMCASWTWYLACDMQFFLIILLLLFIHSKHPIYGKCIYLTLTATSLGISFYLYFINNITYKIDVLENTMDILYVKPWTRMNPYLAGTLVGWILFKLQNKSITIRKSFVVIFWFSTSVLFTITLFISYHRQMSTLFCALIHSVGKYLFGIFIGGIILMCRLGYGDFLATILSHKIFVHLNKLTYSMYMFSPIIITVITAFRDTSLHFEEISMFVYLLGVLAMSYVTAVFFYIFYELPYQKLSDEFILKKKRK